jgi:hypothetical protein
MKKLLLLGLLSAYSCICLAQKVSYKSETIYKDETPYALMKKVGSDFSIKTMSGKEVIFLKDSGHYYEVIFRESGQKAYMEGGTFVGAKKIAKNIVENDLVGAESINAESEKRFVQIYDKVPENPLAKVNVFANDDKQKDENKAPQGNNLNYKMVERERKGEVKVFGKTIQQNFTDLGTFTKENDFHNDTDIYSIFLPDGTKIAEGKLKEDTKVVKLVTLKDNEMHTVMLNETTFDSDVVKQIATYLIERYYY